MAEIVYTEQEKIKVVFSTLVIRLKSLNLKYGSISKLCEEHDISGVTNGKIFAVAAMTVPSDYLYGIIWDILLPLGMVYNEDHVILYEQYIDWNDSSFVEPGKDSAGELSLCEHVEWLRSDMRLEGQFVWYAEPQLTSKAYNQKQNYEHNN
jgi:hypothetical protein